MSNLLHVRFLVDFLAKKTWAAKLENTTKDNLTRLPCILLKHRSTAAPSMRAARYNRAARVTRIRYDNNVRPRALLLKAIDHMLTTLMVLVSSSPHIALLDEGSDGSTFYLLQCSAWMTCVTIAIQILNVLTSSYFQRRMLGADSSGVMLPGARYRQRGPPPTVSDWRGRQCQKKTRFKQCQIRTML